MTVGEMREALENQQIRDSEGMLFRPTAGSSFIELNSDFVLAAFDEIANKIPLVTAGVDEFTAAEKLLFQLFVIHAEYGATPLPR